MKKIIVFSVFLFSFFCFGNVSFAGKLREHYVEELKKVGASTQLDGKKLYQEKMCNSCHGLSGRETLMSNYPKLGGQKFEYLLQQLKDLKEKKRNNGMSGAMGPFVNSLSLDEMRAISLYLSESEPLNDSKRPSEKPLAPGQNGKKLYQEKLCHTCHGPTGESIDPKYPNLASQNASYSFQQLKDIKEGKRANGMSGAMRPFLGQVSATEMKAISDHISTLKE